MDLRSEDVLAGTEATASAPVRYQRTPKRRRVQRLTKRDKITLGVMVAIPVLIEAVLIWIPTILSVLLSFSRWNGLSINAIHFNGTKNYSYVVNEYPPFWPAIRHNILWLIFLSVVATPIGLLLAVLLDQKLRGSRIYQTVFFIPVMMSLALVGIIWQLMYSRDQGFINNLLGTAGKSNAIDWLGNPSINIWSALIAAAWKHAGYIMILYLAGLKGVDPTIKEAAAIDGASARQIFFRVVFPAMRPINIVVVVITIIESLRAFDIVYVFNGGKNGLELISALVIQNLIGEGQVIGVGSALAVILLVVSLIPIVTYLARTFGKEDR
ncbi:MAG: sugar ABC transporter permease [Actinomycetota bacterium]|nr:sugar ABC transporter permease [Actinomycetota bacterium]MDQ2958537.1 sugar ABC transporter permease [Actinomycetota bacterium]